MTYPSKITNIFQSRETMRSTVVLHSKIYVIKVKLMNSGFIHNQKYKIQENFYVQNGTANTHIIHPLYSQRDSVS